MADEDIQVSTVILVEELHLSLGNLSLPRQP